MERKGATAMSGHRNRQAALVVLAFGARRLDEVKAGLECISYREDLAWEQVINSLGDVDIAPIPGPESLFKNARIYKRRVVIFQVETKETVEAGRSKFVEVVKGLEICREK
jgi:hypothetical protein